MSYPTPCKHTNGEGLCDDCRKAFEADAAAYEEFGAHPKGDANFRDLLTEIAAHNHAYADEQIPLPPDIDVPL